MSIKKNFEMTKIALMIFMLMALSQNEIFAQFNEDEMKGFLETYDRNATTFCNAQVQANWDVATDVNNEAKKVVQTEKVLAYANFRIEAYNNYWKNASINSYTDPDVKRKLTFLKNVGTAALSNADLTNLTNTRNRMTGIYNTAKICPSDNRTCTPGTESWSLDPEIETQLKLSRDYDEQLYLWTQWREVSGKKMRDDYKIYIEIMNEAAKSNGFKDAGEMWRSRYEDDKLVEKVDKLWSEVKPLYDELHTYVRYKLLEQYPDKLDKADPNIPAHLFGNMWAQNWVHLYDRTKPYLNGSSLDVTDKIASTMSVKNMFEKSDEFYQSLGLPSSEMSYGDKAMIERPLDREVQCHASAWDFCDGEDFRIKQCTKKTMEDFIVVHHEMGHIMYYLLYKNQSLIYRGGANPGFHEAVGDTIALSVSTPKHLQTVGLLENFSESRENDINSLYHMALERVAFLPFGLLIDKWRWDLFNGQTPETEWNKHWWELREKYQKVRAPETRGEEYFDPGAKFHIPADSQYIAYFVAHILQFSFYKGLCIAADEYDPNNSTAKPLHKCDYYNNTAAGDKLARGLSLGMSKHWSVALEELTGSTEISASALLEYFEPLHEFLKAENHKKRVAELPGLLDKYEIEGSKMCNEMVKAEWGVATDSLNATARQILEETVLKNNKFSRDWFDSTFKNADPNDFTDPLIKRQLKYLAHLGRDALDVADLTELTKTQADIENIYNTAKICPFTKKDCDVATEGLTLEPELYDIMAESTDYDELEWVWTQWREKSGKLMRDGYTKYIELNNKAAKLNDFDDYGAYWRDSYEDPDFIANIDKMWLKVELLYTELHKYVGRKLKETYKEKLNIEDGLIPAHVFGNMWAQSWVNLYDKIKPFSGGSSIDITENMKAQNFTVEQMFEMSNKFFMDLGLPNNSMSYQEPPAVINKPTDRVITCHASAWDFCDGEDFRIKQCTSINQEDFVTVHHEMGHINYFILYKNQPLVLRTGANPGFHEAVGDLIALSVSTPQHLKKVGLLDEYADTQEDNINALFKMALERVAFLPFGLLIDKWRWDVFSGNATEAEWNKRWWEYRTKYQKIKSPTGERNETFFDPGAKYHIPADSQYIAYFVAHILEFQLHRAVCIEAGQYDKNDPEKPLHKCDIDGSTAAGAKIQAGLELGLSQHWSQALKAMTGEEEISGDAIFDYFQPLYDYLKKVNEEADDSGSSMILFNTFLLVGAIFLKYFL